ncbi:hypothetical protein ACT4S2_07980 [Kocuria turfanensis]|uniref:hypothetical protein n=1 Tax=Kocuria turfanensis TaxID=388357 RepID=UPI0040352927
MTVPREREPGAVLTAEDAHGLRRTLLTWLAAVVVLVTGLSSAFNWFFVDRAPQDPVHTWLGGLEDGRSRQLLSRAEAVVADPTLNIFANRVYRNAAGRISGHEVLRVDVQGDRAEIRARVWWDDPAGGERVREEVHTYGVHRVERSGPFNDHWELDSPDVAPLAVHLPAPLDEISVNGESIRPDPDERVPDPTGPGGAWRFEALPGDYAIGLPGNSYYRVPVPLPPVRVAFRDPRPASVDLRIEPSPRMWQETEERITQWLRTCMASEELAPEGCPASTRRTGPEESPDAAAGLPDGDEAAGPGITDVRWRLVSRPALVLVGSPEDPLRWVADPYRPAEARLSYLEDGEPVTERVEFPVLATVRSTGQSAEISVGLE